jgi:hypothetical protein
VLASIMVVIHEREASRLPIITATRHQTAAAKVLEGAETVHSVEGGFPY